MRLNCRSFLLVLMLSAPALASAQTNIEQARSAAEVGRREYNLGHWSQAVTNFEEAYRLSGDAALLFNLAQAHRQAGQGDQALHFYKAYVREQPEGPNRAVAEKQISELKRQNWHDPFDDRAAASPTQPEVGLPPATSPPASAAPLRQAPAELGVSPTTTTPGTSIRPVAPVETDNHEARAQAPASLNISSSPSTPSGTVLPTVGITAIVAGGVAFGVGGYFVIRALSKKSEYESDPSCTYDCPSLDAANSAGNLATGFIATGAVLVGAGIVLYRFAPRLQTRSISLQVAPVVTGDNWQVMTVGRF